MHPHRDMEIVTYVLDGVLEHKDSMGNGSLIQPGEVQRMSAGTGILHSEFNHSKNQPVHLLQIWIQPEQKGLSPGYEQKSFADKKGLFLVGSNNPRDGAVKIHQDVDLLAGRFSSGEKASYELKPNRSAWLHVATGSVKVNGHELTQGDAVAVDREGKVDIEANKDAQVLLFDLSSN
jgi:redox-sensitive bicupin YhaK (pirin superfamily)